EGESEEGESEEGESEEGESEEDAPADESGQDTSPAEGQEPETGESETASEGSGESGLAEDAAEPTDEPAPLRNVTYITALGGGASLGYGSLNDGATGGHGYVVSSFSLEMSRVVGLVAGLGYQFRSGGTLIDESPESIEIDPRLGTAHYLLVEVGARFTVLPDNFYSPRLSALLQGQIELGVEEVNVFANDTSGRAFQEDITPWFVFEYGQPVLDTPTADLLVGLRVSQALASSYRSTGDNSFDLFLNPGGNLDGRLWFTQLGLWVGVEY
ncbi:MAG: hypothetical protein KGO50_15735, partial [Myxococcales bacterium]|nr:hypothetical protein [Myxococcales bacterium]